MQSTILELVQRACAELFAAYDVALAPSEDGELDNRTPCAILHFSGDLGRSRLFLAAAPQLLIRTADPSRVHLDWVGELANQCLGRLKILLLERGVKIVVPPPTIESRLSLSDGWDRAGRVFRSAEGWVWLRLEVGRVPKDLGPPQDPGLLHEGQLVLF
jgi:hypothetical protein